MTDRKFEALMMNCLKANLEYKSLLAKIEAEYERRFNHNPSDIDDDQWIDLFHMGSGGFVFDEIIEYAKEAVERFDKQQGND